MDEHRLVGPLQFGTTGGKKSKHPNMIDKKQWKEFEKELWKKVIKAIYTKKLVPLER